MNETISHVSKHQDNVSPGQNDTKKHELDDKFIHRNEYPRKISDKFVGHAPHIMEFSHESRKVISQLCFIPSVTLLRQTFTKGGKGQAYSRDGSAAIERKRCQESSKASHERRYALQQREAR